LQPSFAVEERPSPGRALGRRAFAGVACLYGANRVGCMYSAKRLPSAGLGVQYVLKPAHGIFANMEFAFGKEDDKAVHFKMGYAS